MAAAVADKFDFDQLALNLESEELDVSQFSALLSSLKELLHALSF